MFLYEFLPQIYAISTHYRGDIDFISYFCIVFQWKRSSVHPSEPPVLQDELASLRAGSRESGACSLFLFETLNSQTMKVYINHEEGTNPVIQNALFYALDHKIHTHLVFKQVVFEVPVWNDFLRAMWHGFSEASKISEGWAMEKKYPVRILTDGGGMYDTELWLDEECRGMHYVSLH